MGLVKHAIFAALGTTNWHGPCRKQRPQRQWRGGGGLGGHGSGAEVARSTKRERQQDHMVATIDETSGAITKRGGRK